MHVSVEVRGGPWVSSSCGPHLTFRDWTWSFPFELGWHVSKFLESTYLHLTPVLGCVTMPTHGVGHLNFSPLPCIASTLTHRATSQPSFHVLLQCLELRKRFSEWFWFGYPCVMDVCFDWSSSNGPSCLSSCHLSAWTTLSFPTTWLISALRYLNSS